MPLWVKISIVIFGLIVFVIGKSSYQDYEERAAEHYPSADVTTGQSDKFAGLIAATPTQISPTGELADMFNLMSNNTDLQRENKLKEIKGQIVEWTMQVYEVAKDGDDYRVQTLPVGAVGAFIYITPRNDEDKAVIAALKTGSRISIKGIIKDDFMRNLVIQPAILFQPDSAKPVVTQIDATLQPESKRDFQTEATQPSQILPSTTSISALVGKAPDSALDDPALQEKFKELLGDKLSEFRERLSVSSGITQEGEWLVGEGGMPHLFSSDEAAFAINIKTSETFAIMLTEGKEIKWFGVDDATKLPVPLQNWYKAHGGS